MSRISLFEAPEEDRAFVAAWRRARGPSGGRLLRSHSSHADFRFAEVVPAASPPPELPAPAHSSRYEAVVDDLFPGAPLDVVLVNPFDVGAGDDDGFVAAWTAVRDVVRTRPGYLGSRLHRTVDADARFRFVTVSPWATVDAFTAAVADPAFARAARTIYHSAHPSLYVAVRDDGRG